MSHTGVYPDMLSCVYELMKICLAMTRVEIELEKRGGGEVKHVRCACTYTHAIRSKSHKQDREVQ